MGTFPKIGVAVLIFTSGTTSVAQDGLVELVRHVSENYHNLRSFEFRGRLTGTIPGTDLQMHVNTFDAQAGRSFVPKGSPVLKYGEALSFHAAEITDAHGKPAAPDSLGRMVATPNHWGFYEQIAAGVVSVKEFPSQVLELDGVPVECNVLEIIYDRERWKPEERTVRYWIDANRLLVVKEEFSELQGHRDNATLWHWVYTVDSVKLNRPPPEWLVEFATKSGDHPRPDWVGREAPDFTLLDLSGREVKLSAMRGKIVLLDFWATWCVPCTEEIPTVEKIADHYKARTVETLGISDEEPSVVKEWLALNKRNLRILIDPEGKVSEQFQVEGIPALVVIGRDGRILSYYTGTQSEQSLCSVIDVALNENPANKEIK